MFVVQSKSWQELSSSLEDYLEALFHIIAVKRAAKARDLASRLKVKAASVTGALHLLAAKKLINYVPYDVITLTPKGEELARDVIRRHSSLKDFFVKVLKIEESEADESACRMEHGISPVILNRLVKFMEFVEPDSSQGKAWIEKFRVFCGKKK